MKIVSGYAMPYNKWGVGFSSLEIISLRFRKKNAVITCVVKKKYILSSY